MPTMEFMNGEILTAEQVNEYLMNQVIVRVQGEQALDDIPGGAGSGRVAFEEYTQRFFVHGNVGWQPVFNDFNIGTGEEMMRASHGKDGNDEFYWDRQGMEWHNTDDSTRYRLNQSNWLPIDKPWNDATDDSSWDIMWGIMGGVVRLRINRMQMGAFPTGITTIELNPDVIPPNQGEVAVGLISGDPNTPGVHLTAEVNSSGQLFVKNETGAEVDAGVGELSWTPEVSPYQPPAEM